MDIVIGDWREYADFGMIAGSLWTWKVRARGEIMRILEIHT